MTTYTTITNALVAVGAKPFATTIQALRDNPLAIAEGDATAPKIAFAAIVDGVAGASAGAVGTYAFATAGATDLAFGSTRAGSSLNPISAADSVTPGATSGAAIFSSGSALSGTWRAMGQYDAAATANDTTISGATLWLRIS